VAESKANSCRKKLVGNVENCQVKIAGMENARPTLVARRRPREILKPHLSGSRKYRETNKIERKSLCFPREREGDLLFLKNKRVKSS